MLSFKEMKKVAVTGLSGFIGRFTHSFLLERGYEVHPLKLSLTDFSVHAEQLKRIRPQALLHFAWDTTPGLFWHTSSNFAWLQASLDLMQTFVSCGGKRAVFAGSSAEKFPSTVYAASKESLRLCAEAYFSRNEVSFAWGRIFSPFGPYEKKERLIPSAINSLMMSKAFKCSSENHVRDFLFVEDAAEAFAALLDSDVKGTVEIGSGEGILLKEVVQSIAEKLNASRLVSFSSSPERADNPGTLVADATRLRQEVCFTPKYSLQEGLDSTIDWWRKQLCAK